MKNYLVQLTSKTGKCYTHDFDSLPAAKQWYDDIETYWTDVTLSEVGETQFDITHLDHKKL